MPNLERDEVVDEPMAAPFYLATSCFHKRNRILRVIFTRISAEPLVELVGSLMERKVGLLSLNDPIDT
ncbi:hypothetical protein, partial [Xanthomonas citri]|uniref:hypothetical protein n=1 Tax=Xanthomonas citri TaxID=346 RepID=UPI003465606C